jgi:ferritin-like metal-binding protein YciE
MKIDSLRNLFVHELCDTLSAEKQIIQALPKVIKAATAPDLKNALKAHLEETKEQVTKLETVFSLIGQSPQSIHCKGMEGLLEEGGETIKEAEGTSVIDSAIIAAAQKVEHYEICAYGTLSAWGKILGEDAACAILEELQEEETQADRKLTEVAESLTEVSDVEEEDEEPVGK